MKHIISSYPNKIVDRCNFDKSIQPYILLHNKADILFTKIIYIYIYIYMCVCVCLCVCEMDTNAQDIFSFR